ncbi:MAG: 3-methyl-2-oxobutanoate hydroxymethyltransferase [Pseudomonadota bacterium]
MKRLPTVADLRALKGQKQLTMLRYFSLEEAAAAEEAGIDIASVPPELLFHPRYREVALSVFSMTGQTHAECGHPDDYLRWCNDALVKGADALYCSGSLATVERLAREYVPVVGHVGLVPARATWTGGFRAVGKTAEAAMGLYREVKAYEDAGAFAIELEVVPEKVATAISARTSLLVWSMGAGAGCDAQYLFASDILGAVEESGGRIPRHAKAYRDFQAEFDRLQRERVAAFGEFRDDVASGAFPAADHLVPMADGEWEAFAEALDKE